MLAEVGLISWDFHSWTVTFNHDFMYFLNRRLRARRKPVKKKAIQ